MKGQVTYMKKHFSILLCILLCTVLGGCTRQPMTAEYSEEENTIDYGELHGEDSGEVQMAEGTTAHEYRSNPFGETDPMDVCNRFKVYFDSNEPKEDIEKKWDSICNLPSVSRTELVTNTEGRFFVKLEDVNPSFIEFIVDDGDTERMERLKEKGKEIRAHIYATDDVEQVTMCMCRMTKECAEKEWNSEQWSFYIEENDEIELLFSDWLGEEQVRKIKVEKIEDTLPWYLNWGFSNYDCNLLIPEKEYREWFGEDHNGKNIRGLFGCEFFYAQSVDGMKDELEKDLRKIGVHELSNAGFLKEE